MLRFLAVSHSRPVVRGACYALTRRTVFRKAFLAPWHPGVNQAWLFSLGYAQGETGFNLHCASNVVTHLHTSGSDDEEKRPEFLRLFHGDLSRALNTLLGRERYDEPGTIFDDRPTHVMRLLDAEAQAAHLVYEAVQCVAAGLVRMPGDMPGFVFDFSMWARGAIRVRRPDFFFDPKTRPDWVEVRFRPPAKLLAAFGGDLKRLVRYMKKLMREAIRELNRARKWPVMGAQRIKRIHPYNEPRTRRETGGRVIPSYKQGARGLTGRRVHIRARTETTVFRQRSRESFRAMQAGKPTRFPYGTYKWKRLFNVKVDKPNPALLITGPEPTLDETLEQLRAVPRKATDDEVRTLIQEVRETYQEEAADVVETNALELADEKPRVTAGRKAEPGARPPVKVKHRFDKNVPSDASRLVVKRDARRGRRKSEPPAASKTKTKKRPKRDSDPPE